MIYLLDTDHLSILQRKAGPEYLRLSTWMAQFNNLRVGTMDLRLTSIALSSNLTVLTRNLRDFTREPGLRSEDRTV